MSDFRQIEDGMFASPQLVASDIAEATRLGVKLVICNRPDDEEAGQPPCAEIEAAARAAGMEFRSIPVTGGGFAAPQVDAMVDALAGAEGPVLAYCRSGTRSTLLWSLAQASMGRDPAEIVEAALRAGYDITPVRPAVEMLAARATG